MSDKASLLAKATEYLKRVEKIIQLINEKIEADRSLRVEPNLAHLLRIKKALEERYLREINSLSDESITTDIEPERLATIKKEEQLKIKKIETALKDLKKDIVKAEIELQKISDPRYRENLKLSVIEEKMKGIQAQISAFSPVPAEDAYNNVAYREAHKKFILGQKAYDGMFNQFKQKDPKTHDDYYVLSLLGEQLLDFHTELQAKYQPLKDAYDCYTKILSEKEQFLSEWSTMNDAVLTELERNYPGDLVNKIDSFQKELAQIARAKQINVRTDPVDEKLLRETNDAILFQIETLRTKKTL
jgi:hypothetical protein